MCKECLVYHELHARLERSDALNERERRARIRADRNFRPNLLSPICTNPSNDRYRSGTHFARAQVMSELLVLLLIVSSIALSVGLSRLAVGEMFRLVSSPRFDRRQPPRA